MLPTITIRIARKEARCKPYSGRLHIGILAAQGVSASTGIRDMCVGDIGSIALFPVGRCLDLWMSQ